MEKIILEPERREITGLSRVQWWREEKAGKAPARRQVSAGRVGWLESELVDWVKSRPVKQLQA